MRMILPLLLFACSAPPSEDDEGDGPGDTAATDSGDTADSGFDADALYGTAPAEAIPAPDFAATNHDGSARSREDLLGHPTVMWFYPAAGTYG